MKNRKSKGILSHYKFMSKLQWDEEEIAKNALHTNKSWCQVSLFLSRHKYFEEQFKHTQETDEKYGVNEWTAKAISYENKTRNN